MKGKHLHTGQSELYRSRLDSLLDSGHELFIMSLEVDWDWIDQELSEHYSDTGRPSVPTRTMVGMMLLKHLYNESDESVLRRWVENPYWQYFTGEEFFQHKHPFDPTDFVYFRKRVGELGMEKVLALSVKLHPGSEQERELLFDTTVQEKDITYPTDDKLAMRVIEYCWKYSVWEEISQRQSYVRVLKKQRLALHNGSHPRRRKKAAKARRKIKTIAGRLVRELQRKMNQEQLSHYGETLEMFTQVLAQKRTDKDKRYSLHEPAVSCIAKGKAHKKFEFGSKVSIACTALSKVIMGIKCFEGSPYDGHTLAPSLEQVDRVRADLGGTRPKIATCDRGYRGPKEIEGTQVKIPSRGSGDQTAYQKRKERERFRRRAGIEPIIGHLKADHRMGRNFLDGEIGNVVNALLAGAAFNFKKRLNMIRASILLLFKYLIRNTINNTRQVIGLHRLLAGYNIRCGKTIGLENVLFQV
ncbi:Bll1957 protein [hydrothermal vent metagenome]|uniref:Bll1957 protein n=1 Tax=hydrothermal vent metagenome TaxID=652676 RepID=A0A3B0Z763_9ZZZZ